MASIKFLTTTLGKLLTAGNPPRPLAARLPAVSTGDGTGIEAPEVLECDLYPGNERKNAFVYGDNTGFNLSLPTFPNGAFPEGTIIQYRMNEDAWLSSVGDFNTELAGYTVTQRKAGFRFTIQIILPANTVLPAVRSAYFLATYYEI